MIFEKPKGKLIPVGEQEVFVIEQGSGGNPLVFLHGGGPGGDSWLDFSPVLPYFDDRHCIFIDLPQYGGSSKKPFEGPNWSYFAKHVIGALDAIGVEKVDFACSSVGGSVALAAAADYPERVRRLVCSGSQPTADAPEILPEQKVMGQTFLGPYFSGEGPTLEKTRTLMKDAEWYDETKIPQFRIEARLAGALKTMELRMTPGASGTREDLSDKLPKVTAPSLFFWGKEDPFLTPEYALRLSRTVQYGDVHVMHKASHHLFAERPKDYALVLRSFLDADLA